MLQHTAASSATGWILDAVQFAAEAVVEADEEYLQLRNFHEDDTELLDVLVKAVTSSVEGLSKPIVSSSSASNWGLRFVETMEEDVSVCLALTCSWFTSGELGAARDLARLWQ